MLKIFCNIHFRFKKKKQRKKGKNLTDIVKAQSDLCFEGRAFSLPTNL